MLAINGSLCIALSALPIVLLFQWWRDPLRKIPTVGPSAPLLSYVGAYRFFHHARDMMHEGYMKYKGSTFKVPLFDKWLVVVSGRTLVEELRRYPDDQASFDKGAGEVRSTFSYYASCAHPLCFQLIQAKYTLGREFSEDPYHIDLIRERLTRNLAVLFPDVLDEIQHAFDHFIRAESDEWISVDALPLMAQIVARASNRIFVGVPYCRDSTYLKLAINFARDVIEGRIIMNLTPPFLRPIVARYFIPTATTRRLMSEIITPLIEERQRFQLEQGASWADKPNDMLMWLLDEAEGNEDRLRNLIKMLLVINFAAIHTSSFSVTHALYHLAARAEYIQPLREEVETVVAKEGWTKAALMKMWKLDSFMKESQRFNGISSISLTRVALQDLHLSDGTHIPAGTIVVAAAAETHKDDEYYPNASGFDPFRFSKLREVSGEGTKHQFVSTSVDYISFGHGKHACPGRFFAAIELKAMLAHVLLNYDVKFERDGVRPENKWVGTAVAPDPTAKVLFRKRQQ
ncbi:cytochrome P450 [Obba rivulosa]|uniref:Cytochrome P450 n=1 Tax=Obba rivulosa TaxID=1052685 RepID=A0A8E2AGF9_9APHY|nr:cytochrome P450 [Obba rivulosa]